MQIKKIRDLVPTLVRKYGLSTCLLKSYVKHRTNCDEKGCFYSEVMIDSSPVIKQKYNLDDEVSVVARMYNGYVANLDEPLTIKEEKMIGKRLGKISGIAFSSVQTRDEQYEMINSVILNFIEERKKAII